MLTEIQIENFAIIENQSISFGDGLNVLTGETGSGKSIILDALGLILGDRASANSIRAGADHLQVHAHFDLSTIDPSVIATLPDVAQCEELAVTRIVSANGRSKVYVNGNLSTVSVLSEIANRLISICSQSQQVRLLNSQYHLSLLDGFCVDAETLTEYKVSFNKWKEIKLQIENLQAREKERASRTIWLEETIEEITAVNPSAGLRATLEQVLAQRANYQKITEKRSYIEQLLSAEDGALLTLSKLTSAFNDYTKLDPTAYELTSEVIEVKELLFSIDKKFRNVLSVNDNFDGQNEDELADRMTKLARLERKHNTDDAGLVDILNNCKTELAQLQNPGKALDQLSAQEKKYYNDVQVIGSKLAEIRKAGSKNLSKNVSKELSELNMSGAKFSVEFNKLDTPTITGYETVEFFLQPNPGEAAKPLRQIASGGELSRILLVLKKILRDRSGVNVLVFDEVDTGISGAVAQSVGSKLKSLAAQSQVICITHLPQVASFADQHLLVEKVTDMKTKRTSSSVRVLSKSDRVNEVARMLSGFEVTETSKKSAKELIENALRS